jgi:hypothetical protein
MWQEVLILDKQRELNDDFASLITQPYSVLFGTVKIAV